MTASYNDAISSVESGGRYSLLGPVTRSGDRAYGKYQVMGANIPQWTQEVLGRAMTPQQFLADPQAQDAVFNAKFGRLAQKYGPEGAARAWFAGEGGMNDLGRRDVLGTSVADYARKFNAALGQQPDPRNGLMAPPISSQAPMGLSASLPPQQSQAQGMPRGLVPMAMAAVPDLPLFSPPQAPPAAPGAPQAQQSTQQSDPAAQSFSLFGQPMNPTELAQWWARQNPMG